MSRESRRAETRQRQQIAGTRRVLERLRAVKDEQDHFSQQQVTALQNTDLTISDALRAWREGDKGAMMSVVMSRYLHTQMPVDGENIDTSPAA